jgi:nicotinamidase-related amidase
LKETTMALTALDPKSALIVIDLQKGILSFPVAHPIAEVLGRAATLAKAFRARGLPVVLVNVTGVAPGRAEQSRAMGDLPPDFADLAPELDVQPTDILVSKRTWGAFTGTDLDKRLRDAGVTQVVVCGVATSIGVESTARQAHELGLNVAVVLDAMTDLSAEAHANSASRIFPRLGETGTAADVLALLQRAA